MHGPIKVKSPNNISKWQMGFNSAFKGLITYICTRHLQVTPVEYILRQLDEVCKLTF
jgi:hypothetical protein